MKHACGARLSVPAALSRQCGRNPAQPLTASNRVARPPALGSVLCRTVKCQSPWSAGHARASPARCRKAGLLPRNLRWPPSGQLAPRSSVPFKQLWPPCRIYKPSSATRNLLIKKPCKQLLLSARPRRPGLRTLMLGWRNRLIALPEWRQNWRVCALPRRPLQHGLRPCPTLRPSPSAVPANRASQLLPVHRESLSQSSGGSAKRPGLARPK